MNLRSVAPTGAVALGLLLCGSALMSRPHYDAAQDMAEPGGRVACVDMEKLYDSSALPQELEQETQQRMLDGQKKLDSISAVPFLDLNELAEFVDLVGKAQPTAAESARMSALKMLSDQRADELRTLSTKSETQLVPGDKARMKNLLDSQHLLESKMPGMRDLVNAQVQEYELATRRQQLETLRVLVAKIARKKNLSQVFDTNALVYSTSDVTQDALQEEKRQPGNK